MGYSKNALKEIIKLSKQISLNGNYIELSDEVLTLGQFYLYESIDVENDIYEEFPCEKCKKLYDQKDLNAREPYLNYCNSCIEKEEHEREIKEYFDSLRKKCLINDYKNWIEKLYPEFRKYF